MKNKILGLLAVGLLAGPVVANAAAITYDFSASNFLPAGAPVSPVSGSFSLDGSSLVGFSMTIGSKAYGLSDVGFEPVFGPYSMIYGLSNGESIQPFTDDFWFLYNTVSLTFAEILYTTPASSASFGSIVGSITARSSVPEPGTLALLGLGLAGLGLSRRRKAN